MSGGGGGGPFLVRDGPLIIVKATQLEPPGGSQIHPGPPLASVFRSAGHGGRFTSVYLSKGNRKRVDGNRRQKEKEVGGVAIQGFANQAEKSCEVEEPKSLQAKSSLLP